MKRKASAVWNGGLRDGKGTMSTDSGVLRDTQYSFATRFENGAGTNPEELIAAAHAGCFSMALSAQLAEAGMEPERIATTPRPRFSICRAACIGTAVRITSSIDTKLNLIGCFMGWFWL